MTIEFIPPIVGVIEDRRVTTAELNWLSQELIAVIIIAVMMTAFWNMIEESLEWE